MLLIFRPDKEDDSNDVPDIPSEEQPKEEQGEEKEYATTLTLNLPSSINMYINSRINLLNGYISVLPSSMLNRVQAVVTPRYNSNLNGLNLNGSELKAVEVGSYKLTFSVPKSATTNLFASVIIYVVDGEDNAYVTQKLNKIYKNKEVSLLDIFTFKESNYTISSDNKISITSDKILGLVIGESNLVISFVNDYIEYCYDFKITVDDQPEFEIFVYNDITTIEIEVSDPQNSFPYFEIYYEVRNNNEQYLNQKILAVIDNEEIACVEKNLSPIIKIKGLKVGTTKITLTSEFDSSITKEITIIVK